MFVREEIQKINETLDKSFRNNKCKFAVGEYETCLKDAINKHAPYSKCAFICNKQTYTQHFSSIEKAIKDQGGKLISFIKENSQLSVDNACELFNLPEDVRAVIVMDNELFDITSYYANVKGIPVIEIVKSVALSNIMSPVLYVKNEKVFDRITITAKKIIIIDEKLISDEQMANAYADIMSKLSAFCDYRINGIVWGKALNKTAYDLARNAVTSEYALFNQPKEKRLTFTLINGIKLHTANYLSNGELFNSSGAYVVGKYLGNEVELYASKCLLGVYDTCINFDYSNLLSIPDYYGRAVSVSNYLNSDVEQIIEYTNKVLKVLRPSLIRANVVLKNLWAEVNSLNKLTSTVQNTYQALGGKILSKDQKLQIISAIRFCGDSFYGVNAMTVLRENGITDTEYFL